MLIVAGKVKEAFATEAEALSAARELANTERDFGREVRAFDVREWRRYLMAKKMYFDGKEPDWAALAAGLATSAPTITVPSAVEKYLLLRAKDGLAAGTVSQLRTKLRRLAGSFPETLLANIRPDDLRAWLAGLGMAQWTVLDHYKVVRAFWHTAINEKWCSLDPCRAVRAPKTPYEEISVLTVDETAKLFAANAGEPVVGRLALEAFGGLRYSSAARLTAADIKWENKGIELLGRKHKSGRRQYLDGLPENLWAWLHSVSEACWEMTERQYERAKIEAFIRASVKSTPNCLRHSFATYHSAAFKNEPLTATLMQHASIKMLRQHYKGRATAADGLKYLLIAPPVLPQAK